MTARGRRPTTVVLIPAMWPHKFIYFAAASQIRVYPAAGLRAVVSSNIAQTPVSVRIGEHPSGVLKIATLAKGFAIQM